MPVVLSSSYGFILPPIFALGTAIPLLIIISIIWYLGGSGVVLKKGRKIGMVIQKIAGALLLLLGIFDTITYWSF